MAADLSQLPAQDRQDFEKRLKLYGLDASGVQDPLIVAGTVSLAYGPGRESARQPHVVRTTDFAAVKRMIGIDDRVFANVGSRVPLPGRIEVGRTSAGRLPARPRDAGQGGAFSASPGMAARDYSDDDVASMDLRTLDDEAITNVRLAARAFVRGNSSLVTSYLPVIQRAVGTITIPVFVPLRVRVPAGTVLEFGTGINVLVAYEVEIENGGTIRSRGHLTISCTKLRRPGGGVIGPLAGGVLTGTFKPIFSEQ